MTAEAKAIAQRIARLADAARSPDLARRRSVAEELSDICRETPELAKSAVPALVHCLCDPDDKVGESALWGLNYCAPESIEPLIELLTHRDPKVRERAAHSLGNIGDEATSACDALRGLLDDPAQEVRARAMWSLGLIPDTSDRTINRLFELAGSPRSADRGAALHALGNIGQALPHPEPMQAGRDRILGALEDDDEDVRWSAGFALESLGLDTSRHVELIMRRLEFDPSDRVREQMAGQLKKLSGVDLLPYLSAMCELVRRAGPETSDICEALGAMGGNARQAVPFLLDILRSEDHLIPAAEALWKIDQRVGEALPLLAKAFDEHGEAVCDAVCEIGPAAAPLIPRLIEALKSADYWDLAWAAADALGHIRSGDPAVVSALASALGHPSPVVRSSAARALARIGAPALPTLRSILLKGTDKRCEWAADAVGQMGPAAAEAAELLRKHLRSRRSGLATWSTIALAKVAGDASLVPALIELLKDERSDLRYQAALGLKAIGPAAGAAVAELRSALDDEDEEVQAAVREALDAIGSRKH
jgi:HEAT repeat protein